MPLQRFKPVSGKCKLCNGKLDLLIGSGAPTPEECPKCGQNIEICPHLISSPPKVAKKPSVSEAKSKGFQVLKRLGKGEYEKQ